MTRSRLAGSECSQITGCEADNSIEFLEQGAIEAMSCEGAISLEIEARVEV